ncbi:MbtH family protein [Methylobacterium marchantiae]|uniref:MbtH family protein n=1 Tax=Methylobacterium marchantiae TaxID=600331 RepID=A0ABW3WZU1_9HYPH|nr:Protein MbtH [Methylobacterium marchantiae]
MALDDSEATFLVVINGEEQYSVWPAHRPVPNGWKDAGFSGTRAACLAHVETVWTDMRPLSLRRALDGDARA